MKIFGALVLAWTLWAGPALGKQASPYNWQAHDWELVQTKNGISTYRKSFEDSSVKGVGGAALIDASAAQIVWVLMDHDHKDQWVDKFSEARTLENPSMLSSIQYAAFQMPAFIDNRDFVYRYDFRYDSKIKAIVVDVVNAVHKKAPASKTVGVRGEIVMGTYRLYERDNGKRTFVEVEYMADPKGLLPTWLVNLVQKTWPHKTLEGLRRQVKKPFVKDHPIVTDGLKQKMAENHRRK
ncbi:MAG: START domain-containing protein [Oligoflexus sp.]